MSRYDDLRPLFKEWTKKGFAAYREYQRLPPILAEGLQKFLGCPKEFENPFNGEVTNYVSPTTAKWNPQTPEGSFTLKPYNVFSDGFQEWEFHTDGRFYFALWVYLETAPRAHPKEPFGILLSAIREGEYFDVRVQKTDQNFQITLGSLETANHFYEHVYVSLKEELAEEPLQPVKKQQIGFLSSIRVNQPPE